MGTAYLVRHFETESNARGLFGDGPLDDVPTERGAKQAGILRCVFDVIGVRIDEVCAGDSVRNLSTASSACGEIHLTSQPTTALNEQHPGEWAGRSKKEILPALLADWRAGNYRIPGSESDVDFEFRVEVFWKEIALPKLRDEKNLIIVTSGNPIRVILGHIWKTPWRHLLPALVCDNCSITVVKVNKEGKCFVGPVNDISHLRAVGVTPIPGT